ncbi:MAG: TonB-dependent receptor [Crocinitomicaceae bacterium]|nr:TonB-dependent receptor [Crocinitomicaceae bacterium]MBK8924780.1 TonB-dependent receptor [Crocinitomicaceae bacterium]
MKTRIMLLIWASIIGVPVSSTAQTTLSGKIKNEIGEGVPGARIMIDQTYQYVVSTPDGTYEITDVALGIAIIEVRAFGYQLLRDTLQISGASMVHDFDLIPVEYFSEEVVVSTTRAGEKTPTTYTNLGVQKIEQQNFGQDMPYLFNLTPSTVVTSDAGAGVGYTGIRIRGVDPTRTNVTINGIPVNDSESHGTWWVNMPDFASSAESVQIQRGVGTSSNGAAAFGASINIKTNEVRKDPYAQISNSFGSFNTLKNTVQVGSGLLNNQFTVDARLSRISSDGYIDRASSNLQSFYLSSAWLGKKSILRATVFGGKEITYQAWNGTPEAVLEENTDSLTAHYYNNLGYLYLDQNDSINLFNAGRTYNYYTYENEVDHYQQTHYQLHFLQSINQKINFNLAGHYTRGFGYYEQFKRGETLTDYGLNPVIISTDTISTTDLIRRRWLDNHFYGAVFSLNYTNLKGIQITWGGAANQYLGKHFGEIIWAEYASNGEIRERYYESESNKTDLSSYLKFNYALKRFSFYADVQFRYIDYAFVGPAQVNGELLDTDQQVNYQFLNPKLGLMYDFNDRHSAYLSFAVANREPVRDDFVNSTPDSRPKHETLQDIELGYRFKARKTMMNLTGFYMNYQNQLILTGAINDVGAYARTNVDKSYRTGLELEAGYMILNNLSVSGNCTYSLNKIPSFTEYFDDYDNGGQASVTHTKTDIAFSPNLIAAVALEYLPIKSLRFTFTTKYVDKQYLDNTMNSDRSLDAYLVSNVELAYTWRLKLFEEIQLGVQLNNIFNELYENNGYTYSYLYGAKVYTENFYYPQAGFNWMSRLVIKF